MPQIYVHHLGEYKQVNEIHVNRAGTWTQVKEVYIKNNGEWTRTYPDSGSIEFNEAGTYEFVVPGGVQTINGVLIGAGGNGTTVNGGGSGDVVIEKMNVTPGETLTVTVGALRELGNTSPGESSAITGSLASLTSGGGYSLLSADAIAYPGGKNGKFGWPALARGRGGSNFYVPSEGFKISSTVDRLIVPAISPYYSPTLNKYGVWTNPDLIGPLGKEIETNFTVNISVAGLYKLSYCADDQVTLYVNGTLIGQNNDKDALSHAMLNLQPGLVNFRAVAKNNKESGSFVIVLFNNDGTILWHTRSAMTSADLVPEAKYGRGGCTTSQPNPYTGAEEYLYRGTSGYVSISW